MKSNCFYLWAALALLGAGHPHALAAGGVAGVFPNTNIVRSVVMGFVQGTCNDGSNTFAFFTDAFRQMNSNYQYVGGPAANRIIITNEIPNFGNLHLGDPDYYQGYLYVPMEGAVGAPPGSANVDIAIFVADSFARSAVFSVSNYQSEISAVCIDPVLSNSVALFAASYYSLSNDDGIYEYSVDNLTNLTFVKALPLTRHLGHIQGIICIGGMLYAIADNGPAGELYQIDPTNAVVTHLVQFNIAGQREWEGLDYYQGFLVAAEGGTGTINSYDFFNAANTRHVSGSVVDNFGNPIVGVGVIASGPIDSTNQIVTVDTDTNGNYSLVLTNGYWSVALNCAGGNDSLSYLGNYSCPNVQNLNLLDDDAVANFRVQTCSVLIRTPAQLPRGEVGVPYYENLQAIGCYPDYTWSLIGGDLPPGLSLSSGGTISGTPSGSGGVFEFVVQVTDSNNSTTNQNFSLGVYDPVQIATTSLPAGAIYNVTLSATNGQPPYAWSLSPGLKPLPPNLILTPDGMLSCTVTTGGTFNLSVRVKDSLAGVADQTFVVNLPDPLAISNDGGQISVLWPAAATNYVLQSATDLLLSDWVTVTDAVPGSAYIVTNPAPQQFFRLQ